MNGIRNFHWRRLMIGIGVGSLLAAVVCTCPAEERESAHEAARRICGPLSVWCLLRGYGMEPSLAELVEEIQQGDNSAGASLQSLADSLTRRGVDVLPVENRPGRLEWNGPAILHVRSERFPRGHYVVLLPGDPDGERQIWDCGDTVPLTDYQEELTGAALLTGAEPAGDSSQASWKTAAAIAVSLICLGFFGFEVRALVRRT